MEIVLLLLVFLTLLFGAGVIKGILRNVFGFVVGIVLFASVLVVLLNVFGEGVARWIWIGSGTVLFIGAVWARSYDPREAEHKARVRHAQRQRDERRKNGLKW